MTDKQIIIDDQKKTIHRLQDECTEKTNVIIALGEQLKRKEQECEKKDKDIKFLLKSLDNSYKMRDDCESHWDKKRKELKQQLDQLKKQHESDKGLITQGGKLNYQLLQEVDKLKTCVAEIKEIAETAVKVIKK